MRFLECIDGPYEGHVVLVPEHCRDVAVRGPTSRGKAVRYEVHRLKGKLVLRHDAGTPASGRTSS